MPPSAPRIPVAVVPPEKEPSLGDIAKQLRDLSTKHDELMRVQQENGTRLVQLYQLRDPLTWKRRAALLFAGACAGSAAATAAMSLAAHIVIR